MDLQQAFDFEQGAKRKDALRVALKPYGLPDWSVELIVLLALDGRPREIAGQQCYELCISKRKAGKAMGCAANTFAKAADDLHARGVLEIVDFGQRRTYFLSRDRVNSLAPISDDPIDELGLFGHPPPGASDADQIEKRSALVSAGQSARVRDTKKHPSRPYRVREPVSVNPEGLTSADQPAEPAQAIEAATLRTVTDGQLRTLDEQLLQVLFRDCVGQRWLSNTRDDARKFLALVHHAVRSPGIHSPAKVVYAAVRKYQFDRVNQESWDWSAKKLKREESHV